MYNMYPHHRISHAEKMKDNAKWGREFINILCEYRTQYMSADLNFAEMQSNYRLFNNILDQKDFERECNLLGLQVGQFVDEIKPYNKSANKIQVLLGEELKKRFEFKAINSSESGIKSKLRRKDELTKQYLQAAVDSVVAEAKQQTGEMSEEEAQQYIEKFVSGVMDPKQIEKYMNTTYQEGMEILANKLLTIVTLTEDIKTKRNDSFKHALISDCEFVWVGSENGNPVVHVVNPLNIFYQKNQDTKYIEDGLYAGSTTKMDPFFVMSAFGDMMKPEDRKRFEDRFRGSYNVPEKEMKYSTYSPEDKFLSYQAATDGQYGSSVGNDVYVTHIEWKSERKMGKLSFVNEYGDTERALVSEDYVIPEYATKAVTKDEYGNSTTITSWDNNTLEWEWLPEVWSGIRIDEDIFVSVGPKAFQHRDINNPKKCLLGYHGLVHTNMNAESCSLMSRLKPFQYLYFLVAHRMKRMIAKDKGQVFHIDTTMIDPEIGLEKTLYYLDELDLDFFNPLQNAEQPGAFQRGKISGSTSRSNMQHIMQYINVLNALDEQISDVAGIPKGREGQQSPNETVGNNRQSLVQSATITEIYFYNHNRVWERVLNSLLDLSAFLYKDKHVFRSFLLDDLSNIMLDIKPGDLSFESMQVRVLESSRQHEAFEFAKQHFLALLQNDRAKFSDIFKLFESNSASEYKKQIEESERMQEEAQQSQQQSEQQMQEKQLQIQIDLQKLKHEQQMEIEELKAKTSIQKAEIDVFKFQEGLDSDGNGVPDPLEIARLRIEKDIENRKLDIADKKVEVDKMKAKQPKSTK